MINILFSAQYERWDNYQAPLRDAFAEAGLIAHIAEDIPADQVDYIIYAPNGPVTDFSAFPRLKAVLSLWAGVESILGKTELHVPLCRMVDPGLSEGMTEWVTGHVLRHHLNMDKHILGQDGVWRQEASPLARDRGVGILGLGALGQACAKALLSLNFNVHGWSRTEKSIDGVHCHFGAAGLVDCLRQSHYLVVLLPLTDATHNLLDATALAALPQGAAIINAGRGALIDDDALLDALTSEHLGHATLDVFRVEPLPEDHAFWAHPKVTVTPHIAAETRPALASRVIAENVRRGEAGEPYLNVVDVAVGY